ncbi:hypothetical protein INR49_019526 [Caranx melampygus]|nr:hypothetical protein INR49_019526 [Caranx melampygus]
MATRVAPDRYEILVVGLQLFKVDLQLSGVQCFLRVTLHQPLIVLIYYLYTQVQQGHQHLIILIYKLKTAFGFLLSLLLPLLLSFLFHLLKCHLQLSRSHLHLLRGFLLFILRANSSSRFFSSGTADTHSLNRADLNNFLVRENLTLSR